MPSTVHWAIEVNVDGGPASSISSSFLADGYSVAEVATPAGDSVTTTFEAAPVGDVDLVLIVASQYHPTDLTYTLGGATVALDAPQLFVGAGQLGRFGADLSDITVDNDLGDDVTVTALAVRRA